MVDSFLTAVSRKGPRFTRQLIKGETVEFARLDWIYSSTDADWIESIDELHHDETEDIKREEIKVKLRETWKNHPASVTDPRVRWDLGWQRIKKILQRERREQKLKKAPCSSAQEQLEAVRTRINANFSEQELEKQVKEQELREAAA
ncbi:hypothetical protein R1sor_017068 [Riccia sorocarpa]|uniref:Uncharacterized protein n=1 Tax=Riccia sorocarpa TaxID=122646 RepID=A0ABD3I6W4_9MARC